MEKKKTGQDRLNIFLKKHLRELLMIGIPTVIAVVLFFYFFVGAGMIFFLFVLAGGSFVVFYNNSQQKKHKLPVAAVVAIIGIPLFFWGLWVLSPEWFAEWMGSRYFLWMILALGMFIWLSGHKNHSVASVARMGLGALILIAIIAGVFGKTAEVVTKKGPAVGSLGMLPPLVFEPKNSQPLYKEPVVRQGQAVIAVVPGNWEICFWRNKAEVMTDQELDEETLAIMKFEKFHGVKKRWLFFTKPEVAESNLRFYIYDPKHMKSPC